MFSLSLSLFCVLDCIAGCHVHVRFRHKSLLSFSKIPIAIQNLQFGLIFFILIIIQKFTLHSVLLLHLIFPKFNVHGVTINTLSKMTVQLTGLP